ncbi:Parafibromin [Portunus trituberculatus]|uniref:Parafibromin n=1 Tax=Portunus trituberculatus TaxID=210409 RepID=A0A5B7DI10_PORTR|nr:Parafibromin [Portunus trituberculatus]
MVPGLKFLAVYARIGLKLSSNNVQRILWLTLRLRPSVCAFHIKFEEMNLDGNIAKWAVHVINLSRERRHLDRARFLEFWEKLDRK